MHTRAAPGQGGFTYFMLLWWVALSGVALMALSHNWTFERRREKEVEMVARAEEIRAAIASYRLNVPGGQLGAWPASLQDLVEDKRGPRTVRHLRRVWVDPLTGRADWGLLRDLPAAAGKAEPGAAGGIRGVYSRALGQPIRGPAGIKGYGEWRFEASVQANGP
jgi:type II secretory pathway pseudopilin PulG